MTQPHVAALCIFRSSASVVVAKCNTISKPWPQYGGVHAKTFENSPELGISYTFQKAGELLRPLIEAFEIQHLAISCFGPFQNLNTEIHRNEGYGRISKLQSDLGANGVSLVKLAEQYISDDERLKITISTDANALALGELCRRADAEVYPFSSELPNYEAQQTAFARATVVSLLMGKGVGGGLAYAGGDIWQQHYHPEMGHIPALRLPADKREGMCPAHHDCITGLMSRASLEKNGRISDESWLFFSHYAAHLISVVACTICPDVVVLSGSLIRQRPEVLRLIEIQFQSLIENRTAGKFGEYLPQERDALRGKYISLADPRSQVLGTLAIAAFATNRAKLHTNSDRRTIH